MVRARTDREAFGRLYDTYYPRVFRYCHRRLFMPTVAEDVTSETFLRVASQMREFAGTTEGDFRRWLFRIATNEVNAYLRQTKRRRALLESAARSGALPVGDAPGSRASEIDPLDWPTVYQAILGLPVREQAILTLRFFEQMSHAEIAEVLGERPATVRTALSRTLKQLRQRFPTVDDPIVRTASPKPC